MIKLISFLVLVITATAMAVVLPGQMRTSVTLTWDYDTNSPPDAFKLYSSTNLALPTTNWALAATVPGSTQTATVSNIAPRQCWYYVAASNWFGESNPSNIAGTPQPPGTVSNLRISP